MSLKKISKDQPSNFEFNKKNLEEAQKLIKNYPDGKQQSAVMPLLFLAQKQNDNWIPLAAMKYIAKFLSMPYIKVYEVATFYSMFQTEPVGRNEIAICTNISCMLSGSDMIVQHIEDRLNIKLGESTKDGNIFLKKEEECLAACTGAPMMMVNHQYIENLDIEKVNEILDKLEK